MLLFLTGSLGRPHPQPRPRRLLQPALSTTFPGLRGCGCDGDETCRCATEVTVGRSVNRSIKHVHALKCSVTEMH